MIRASAPSALLITALAVLLWGCNEQALQAPPDGSAPVLGLSAEQSTRVLAKIGDRAITLGDFARTLDRMDQFDRLRFQTKERRRELLGEMIDVELLAAEAKRRGLDKDAEVQDAIRQILRDAMLAQARQGLPAPADIPAQEVRAYYDANVDKFTEPERRRVAAIVMSDKALARKVLEDAQKATGSAWGELFLKHSLTAPKDKAAGAPPDLAGDLGIVSPPGDARGSHPEVPEPVRAAVFRMAPKVGAVADELVEADGRIYLVRLSGITAGHRRSLAEADRSIRVALIQQRMKEQESALEAELKKKFPVEINEAALATVKLPQEAATPAIPGAPTPAALPGDSLAPKPSGDAAAPPSDAHK